MHFGRFRILGKLTLLVLVPLLGVVALAVPIVVNRVDAARQAQRNADTVELAGEVGSALQELQEERLLSIGYLFGLVQRPELVVQSAKVDDRVDRLRHLDQDLSPQLTQALDWVANLDRTREQVLARKARPDFIINDFTNVVTPIIDALGLTRQADLTTAEVSRPDDWLIMSSLRIAASSARICRPAEVLRSASLPRASELMIGVTTLVKSLTTKSGRALRSRTWARVRSRLPTQSSAWRSCGDSSWSRWRRRSMRSSTLARCTTSSGRCTRPKR